MIFKNAFIVDRNDVFDVKIENGIIVDIDKNIKGEGIDLNGKILSRGLIDMHCHLREPGYEYKETIESGIASAINGGYCAVCPMANTNPVCDNVETLKFIISKADGFNLFPICATTKNLAGVELSPINDLKIAGAIAFSNDGKPVENQEILSDALKSGELIISHAEVMELNGTPESEYEAVRRDLNTLRQTGGKYHFAHISTKESVDLIRQAKEEGLFYQKLTLSQWKDYWPALRPYSVQQIGQALKCCGVDQIRTKNGRYYELPTPNPSDAPWK